jgi:hypothetical protein
MGRFLFFAFLATWGSIIGGIGVGAFSAAFVAIRAIFGGFFCLRV